MFLISSKNGFLLILEAISAGIITKKTSQSDKRINIKGLAPKFSVIDLLFLN